MIQFYYQSNLFHKFARFDTRFQPSILVNYEEHANNNTLKTLHAMKYLMENANENLSNLPKFIMKTDDDIYVNIPNLMQLLNKNFHERYVLENLTRDSNYIQSTVHKTKFKTCSLERNNDAIFGSTGVLLDVVRPTKEEMESKDNQILSYIVSPYYMYDQEYYPQFLSGSGKFLVILSCFMLNSLQNALFKLFNDN